MQIVAGSSQQLNIGNKIKSLRSEKIYRKVAFCQDKFTQPGKISKGLGSEYVLESWFVELGLKNLWV
ncbi:hypothetical protein NC652_003412 [Populus alba x Populus x berolinensis]|nr:hypothetical protein NC652_003412 [Populus alba x Populus x berolinensis]